jgi:hypothetical protein
MASSKTNLDAGDLFLSEDPHGGVAAWENKERDPPGFHRLLHLPFEDGRWKEYCRELFTNHRSNSAANQVLSNVLKLQDKKCICAYLFSLGLDDQNPAQWVEAKLSHLVVPESDYASDSEEEEGEKEKEEEEEDQRGGGAAAAYLSHLVVPDPDYAPRGLWLAYPLRCRGYWIEYQ